ncbi:hypothetical protein [Janthinobacterium sp. BJB304]|uniref:hypothetical protein n=1 Tax=Janthinobacterium sp. BJB304 TaxID=1572871 RepID=UPI00117A75CB|nr:hypothetical protein [Janthinobacterium sp. BJB304]
MWALIKEYQFLVGAATGSLASYLLGLVVSHVRREKRWLGFSVVSRNIIQAGPQKLTLTYAGAAIKRMDSHTVSFRNIGNRPLKDLPVRIVCINGGSVLDYELSAPAGTEFGATSASDYVSLTIDLLNPGEVFSVGLTVADANGTGGVTPIARAEYLELRDTSVDHFLESFSLTSRFILKAFGHL